MQKFRSALARVGTAVAVRLLVVVVLFATVQMVVKPQQHERLVSAIIPTATLDTSSDSVGIADSNLYAMSAADVGKTLDAMLSLGVNQVRVFIPWAAIQPLSGTYDWTQLDMVVNAAAARNMAVVGDITSSPIWASSSWPVSFNGAPTSVTAFSSFVSAVASRYSAASSGGMQRIQAYEVWNEPNTTLGWFPTPNAAGYTTLLKAAYTAIKAADPNAQVVAGVLASVVSFMGLTLDPVTYLQQMYASGAKGFFDALSFHPYHVTMEFSDGIGVANSPYQQLLALRALMDANGDISKLIWATEYGQPTSQVSQAVQAQFIQDFLSTWSTMLGVGPMFLYTTRDVDSSSSSVESTLGIFQTNWTPKLAAQVIANFIAGNPQPPTPGSVSVKTPAQALAVAVALLGQQISNAINVWVQSMAASFKAAATAAAAAVNAVAKHWAAAVSGFTTPTSDSTTVPAGARATSFATVTASTSPVVAAEVSTPSPAAKSSAEESNAVTEAAAVPAVTADADTKEPVNDKGASDTSKAVVGATETVATATDGVAAAADVSTEAAPAASTPTASTTTAKVADTEIAAPTRKATRKTTRKGTDKSDTDSRESSASASSGVSSADSSTAEAAAKPSHRSTTGDEPGHSRGSGTSHHTGSSGADASPSASSDTKPAA